MELLLASTCILISCLIIWRACDGFEAASEYIGRNLSDGVRGATINAIGSSIPELLTTMFFLLILHDKDGFAGGIGTTAGSAIFNGMITDWEHHLQHLTNFWSNQLFIERGTYRGNPIAVHQKVDNFTKNAINEMHFGIWINHWFATLDEHFEGENANIAKNRARNIASNIHLNIFMARTKK